jgi:hypothetical protein
MLTDSDAAHAHWQRVYASGDPARASWHQAVPRISLELIERTDVGLDGAVLYEAVEPGGWVILATHAPDGPTSCSGLPTCRYDGPALAAELGQGFHLVEEHRETHRTPSGGEQRFAWSVFRRSDDI